MHKSAKNSNDKEDLVQWYVTSVPKELASFSIVLPLLRFSLTGLEWSNIK